MVRTREARNLWAKNQFVFWRTASHIDRMGMCAAKEKGAPKGGQVAGVPDITYKVLIIGAANAGKTSMLNRFINHSFPVVSEATLCDGPIAKDIKLNDGKLLQMLLVDTAGQEKFRTITSSHYRGCEGVIVVFDLNDPSSASSLPNWLNEIDRYAGDTPQILVGNKKDLGEDGRAPIPEEVTKKNLAYFECSALTGEGIDEVFMGMANEIQEHLM